MRTAQPDHDHHPADGEVRFHSLLLRQLRKAGVSGPLNGEWLRLLTLVSDAYHALDQERRRNDRAARLMSEELTDLNETIRQQAHRDPLTGTANRALLMDRLASALSASARTCHSVALLFVDLDDFKLVNDTLGHSVGDQLLKEVTRRLEHCIRAGDTLARLGGDEFIVLMPGIDALAQASGVAERIIAAVEHPFRLDANEILISAAIGIAAFPDDAIDGHGLLVAADAAMYRAKEQGKGHYAFFTNGLNDQVQDRLALKHHLLRARERGEFRLAYQPKLSLDSGRINGVEALLRWDCADLGAVPPERFIPLLEETGQIVEVGRWVLEEACRQARAWLDAGAPPVRVAVNISARQLREPGLCPLLAGLVEAHRLPPGTLELEITESMIIRDAERAALVLEEVRAMGMPVALDDFGTGYSSLSYLRRFPFDSIKIDRSFVQEILSNGDDVTIVRAIIAMGQALRRRIVAEGVETEAQGELLALLGVDELQGYAYGRPMPAAEVLPLLLKGSAPERARERDGAALPLP